MKRKERHLTVTGWVVVGLLDTLAGVISGGLMALWQLPSTYRWRGYWAIGGEWIKELSSSLHGIPPFSCTDVPAPLAGCTSPLPKCLSSP